MTASQQPLRVAASSVGGPVDPDFWSSVSCSWPFWRFQWWMVTDFEQFFDVAEPRLRAAFVGRYGPSTGRVITVDALSYAWEHWDRIRTMENPFGYLYRVGQSAARRYDTRTAPWGATDQPGADDPGVEPALGRALADLPERQRVVVFLVHAMQWTHREVAEMLEVSASTVQTHLERALESLRTALEVPDAR